MCAVLQSKTKSRQKALHRRRQYHRQLRLPSEGLTALFGMGRGGHRHSPKAFGAPYGSLDKDTRTKKALKRLLQGFDKIWRRPTLPPVKAVPSAQPGLTALFGMGRGGHRHYNHHIIFIHPFGGHGASRKLSGHHIIFGLKTIDIK